MHKFVEGWGLVSPASGKVQTENPAGYDQAGSQTLSVKVRRVLFELTQLQGRYSMAGGERPLLEGSS